MRSSKGLKIAAHKNGVYTSYEGLKVGGYEHHQVIGYSTNTNYEGLKVERDIDIRCPKCGTNTNYKGLKEGL